MEQNRAKGRSVHDTENVIFQRFLMRSILDYYVLKNTVLSHAIKEFRYGHELMKKGKTKLNSEEPEKQSDQLLCKESLNS